MKTIPRFLICTIVALVTVGCNTSLFSIPTTASIHDAFPDGRVDITSQTPAFAYKTVTFDAPYDAVYRATSVAFATHKYTYVSEGAAHSPTAMVIEAEDKQAGIILGTLKLRFWSQHYYAARVKRVTAGRTEVTVVCKDQMGMGSVAWCEQGRLLDGIGSQADSLLSATRVNLIQSGDL